MSQGGTGRPRPTQDEANADEPVDGSLAQDAPTL